MPPVGGCSTAVNRSSEFGDSCGGRWIWTNKREIKTADVFWRTATVTANDDAATTTIKVGSPTDLPLFVVFLQICKIVVPIGFGFFYY